MPDPTDRAEATVREHPDAMPALDRLAAELGTDMAIAQLSPEAARHFSALFGQEIPPDSFLCARADPERKAHPADDLGAGDTAVVTLDGRTIRPPGEAS